MSDPVFTNFAEHPWEIISEEMDARGWSMDDLATRMGWNTIKEWQVDRLTLDVLEVIRSPKARLGETLARKLSFAFGVSAEFFLNLDKAWLARPDIKEICAMRRAEIAAGVELGAMGSTN